MTKKLLFILAISTLILWPSLTIAKAETNNRQGNKVTVSPTASTSTESEVEDVDEEDVDEEDIDGEDINDESDRNEIKLKNKDWNTDLKQYQDATQANKITRLKTLGATLIENRIASLNSLKTRITNMANLEATTKTTMIAELDKAITDLTALGTKIQADTDLTTLKADVKSIYETYRVYAVILPKNLGLASVERGNYILGRLTALDNKLKTMFSANVANSGELEQLQNEFDLKIADAQAQLAIAETQFKQMTPANTETAKQSREAGKQAFEKAKQDLKDAHDILKQIMNRLRFRGTPSGVIPSAVIPSVSASASPTASTLVD